MKTLFLFIPNFVFSSDLLQTDYIKYLASKYKVIVFSPIFKSASFDQYYKSSNVEYITWDIENPRFWLFWTKTLRISLIREFDELKYYKLRRFTKTNLNWKRKLLRTVGWFIPRLFLTADFFTKTESGRLPNSKRFQEVVKKYNPSLVLTCTPGFSSFEAEAIITAKKNRLTTVAINSSWDNYTSNATQLRKTDYLICWNGIMKKEAINIHNYPDNKVFISGTYRFGHHFQKHENELSREEFLNNKNLNPKLKTLFLSTVPPNTYPPQYDVWKEIIKMRDTGKLNEDVNIFIRLHPNDLLKKYAEFKNIRNLHIDLPGKQIKDDLGRNRTEMNEKDLENLRLSLKYTDININFRSSIGLEAIIYNKPVINLALYNYALRYQMDHYIPILKSGGVKMVETSEQLRQTINDYLKNPELDTAGRKKIFEDFIMFSDDLSYKRSVDVLAKMI